MLDFSLYHKCLLEQISFIVHISETPDTRTSQVIRNTTAIREEIKTPHRLLPRIIIGRTTGINRISNTESFGKQLELVSK